MSNRQVIDILILTTVFIYIIGLPVKREKLSHWYHLLPFASLVLSTIQLLFDGFRWQMAAIYLMIIILFFSTLSNFVSGLKGKKVKTRTKKWIRVTGLIAGIIICSLSLLAMLNFPRFKFPEPTGEYAVGTDYFLFTDNTRSDFIDGSPGDFRTISVQTWYPSQKYPANKPIKYQKKESAKSIGQLLQIPDFMLNYLTQINTHSYEKAKLPDTDTQFPVIVFSPSAWINHTTVINEELASHGFVVFAVGHTSTEPFIYDSNGDVMPLDYHNPYHQKLRQELNSTKVESIKDQIIRCTNIKTKRELHQQLNQFQPLNVRDIQMRAQDIRFLIDKLPELNAEVFSGKLELNQIGIMGFSKGGATAGEVCVNDTRVKAGLNMDGFMYGDIVNKSLKIPFMFMHSVTTIESAFINDWFYQETTSPAYMLKIKGTIHSDFGDGGLGRSGGKRCLEIQRAYVLAFFNKHLKGKNSSLLNMKSTGYPEVEFFMKSNGG